MYKGVIFDLDGTLLDTFADLKSSVNFVLSSLDLPLKETEEYLSFIGHGIKHFLHESLPENNKDLLERALQLFQKHYSENCFNQTKPYKNIPELLRFFKEKNLSMSILSNKQNDFLQKVVAHFFDKETFQYVFGLFSDYPKKPDPTLAKILCKKMGLNPQDILYIGDSVVDIQTADRAGFHSGFVLWGFSPQDCQLCPTKHIFHSPLDIKALF